MVKLNILFNFFYVFHFQVVSCGSRDLAAWWMGALKAAYPQDHYSDSGENLKMHPAMGVTLKLNRNDGTLKIKGKKHMDWFKDNFEQVNFSVITVSLKFYLCRNK